MIFSSDYKGKEDEIIDLYIATFSDSEGSDEGKLIGGLVKSLLETTKENDLFIFLSWNEKELVGSIIFSRLTYPEDKRNVFILAPVAVTTSSQRKGIGQSLLNHGLNNLKGFDIDVVITYGDPNYYEKVGFKQISEEMARAPLKLRQPEGWLAQTLNHNKLYPLKGPSHCVEALNNQIYW